MILTTDSRIIGIDSNNKQVRLCRFEVDAISDLPTPDVWESDGVIICMGSTAHVIEDNSEQMLDSSGQWVQQVAGTSSYTRSEIDTLLLDKVDTSTYATDKAALDAELDVLSPAVIKAVDDGAKNLLEITATTQTINGVTFTVNADQTITVNGTNNTQGAITYMFVSNDRAIKIPDGEYILSGCPQGGGPSTYDLRWYLYSSGKSAYDNGSGATVNKSGNTTTSNIAIIIRAGVTVSNLIFKPMICTAADWAVSQKFVPYCPTLYELYQMVLALQ